MVLALYEQFKANIIRMQHLYNMVDNKSASKMLGIPNQDCKEQFLVDVFWTARSLRDWTNNWFIKRNQYSCTPLYDKDYWLPGLTG